jgi:hypothetical protein
MTIRQHLVKYWQSAKRNRSLERRPKHRQRLFLEHLEERTMPTVLFAPQFGNEGFLQDGGKRINSPAVYVVLWGKSWTGPLGVPTIAATQVLTAANNLISSHYLDALSQYGVTTGASLAGTVYDNFNNQDPQTGFQQSTLTGEIQNLINQKILPNPANTPNMIVDMVTAPGIASTQAGTAGYNNAILDSKGNVKYGFIWNGTSFGSLSRQDAYSLIFSHELAENMTDPAGKGYEVTAGSTWNIQITGSPQIGDFEGNNYQYRLSNGTLVQPYWSAKWSGIQNTWIVTDENSQIVAATPQWKKNLNGTPNSFNGYDVTINDDKLLSFNNTTTVDDNALPFVPSVTQVRFNGESFNFDDSRLVSLTINTGLGVDTVQVNSAPRMNIAINGNILTTVIIGTGLKPTAANIAVKNARMVSIGGGRADLIAGIITIADSAGTTALVVDDSADPNSRTISLSRTSVDPGLGPPIDFSKGLLSSLTIFGGRAGNGFVVRDTSAPATLNTGPSADKVFVLGTSAPLTINGQNGADKVVVGNAGSLQSINGMLTVLNPGSFSSLLLDDTADPDKRTLAMGVGVTYGTVGGLAPALIRYRPGQIRSLTVSAGGLGRAGGGNDDFTINNTNLTNSHFGTMTTVKTGGGQHSVQVNGTTGPLTINAQGLVNGITVGSTNAGLNNINGNLYISGPGAVSSLFVNDAASTTGHTYSVDHDVVERQDKATINYQDLSNLTLTAGPQAGQMGTGGNTVNITGTLASVNTTVLTGLGNDTVNVGNSLDAIQGPLTIDGQGGMNQLVLSDSAATTTHVYTLSAVQFDRVGSASVNFSNLSTITFNPGAGANSIGVNGTAPGTTLVINGGVGPNETIVLSADQNALLGPIELHIQSAAHDLVDYGDTNNPNPQTYTVTSTTISRSGQADVTYDGAFAIFLFEPTVGGNKTDIQSIAAGSLLKCIDSNGDQVIVGSQAPNTGGNLSGILDTVEVTTNDPNAQVAMLIDDSGNTDTTAKQVVFAKDSENLINMVGLAPIAWRLTPTSSVKVLGGAADETFVVQPFLSETPLSIDGGGGANTLDYTGFVNYPGLVAWYPGEANSNDIVGGNNGSLAGNVTFDQGMVGQAFRFDGTSSYVRVPDSQALEPSTLSVEAWVNSSVLGSDRYIIAKGANGGTAASYALSTGPQSGLRFYVYDGGTFVESPDAGTAVWDGKWHHVVGTYDGASVRLYVDGTEVGNGTPTNLQISYALPTTNDLFIGTYGDLMSGHFFNGLVDEPSIYNRALSAAEVQALFAAGSAGKSALAGIYVNLQTGTASGLSGIANIQNVTGSPFDDILVGNGGNVLNGGGGNNLLIAGGSASTLIGGPGSDILIGGTTDYDTNQASLQAILNAWNQAPDYLSGVTALTNGLLGAGHVHQNGGGNQLTGGAGLDLFFAGSTSEVLDLEAGEMIMQI